jgi:hypothetical protein
MHNRNDGSCFGPRRLVRTGLVEGLRSCAPGAECDREVALRPPQSRSALRIQGCSGAFGRRSVGPFAHRLVTRAIDVHFVIDRLYPFHGDEVVLAVCVLSQFDLVPTFEAIDDGELPVVRADDWGTWLDLIRFDHCLGYSKQHASSGLDHHAASGRRMHVLESGQGRFFGAVVSAHW